MPHGNQRYGLSSFFFKGFGMVPKPSVREHRHAVPKPLLVNLLLPHDRFGNMVRGPLLAMLTQQAAHGSRTDPEGGGSTQVGGARNAVIIRNDLRAKLILDWGSWHGRMLSKKLSKIKSKRLAGTKTCVGGFARKQKRVP